MIYSMLISALLVCAGLVQARGDYPIKIVNNANNATVKNIYSVIKGINPDTGRQCFVELHPDGTPGRCVDITLQTDSKAFAYNFKDFKDYTFHIPNLISGRMYVSINNKLTMPIVVDAVGNLGIADPSPYNTSDPSYNTFFDKIEFTYIGNATWTNPTAVDFFALPLIIQQNGHTYGITKARKTVLSSIADAFHKAPNQAWQKLVVKNHNGDVLRVLAPGRDDNYFDPNYLTGSSYNYVEDVWNYYRRHTLTVDCSELQGNPAAPQLRNYLFTGMVVGNTFIFTNQTNEYSVVLEKPSSNVFFLGAQGAFDAPNNTPKAIIVRNISAAWCVGLLPAEDGAVLNRAYFDAHQGSFYTNNPRLSSPASYTGPYYNLYGKAIHAVSRNVYTWPYDDAFGYDGTNASTDANPAILKIGDLSGTTF